MDEAFLIRARRMLGSPARMRLDHDTLVAQLTAQQDATPTAQLAADAGNGGSNSEHDSAAVLISGASGWRGARAAQDGCFNRAVAVRRLNTP